MQLTRQEIATKTAERQEVLAAIADYQKRIESLPIREQEMSSLTRDYEMTKANYRSLLDKKMSAEMATDMERHQKAERFTIVNPAKAPARPFKPKRQLLAMAGGVISLLLALSLVIAKGFHENLILGEWELGEHAPNHWPRPEDYLSQEWTEACDGKPGAVRAGRNPILLYGFDGRKPGGIPAEDDEALSRSLHV